MKDLNLLNEYRKSFMGDSGDDKNGIFEIKVKGELYRIVASNGAGWDHISVSHRHKIPSWKVMSIIKDMFFNDDEVVMQLHPAKDDYINNHNNCLHLWKPQKETIPTPPSWMVGIKGLNHKDFIK